MKIITVFCLLVGIFCLHGSSVLPAGILDSTFGNGGYVTEQIPNYQQFQLNAIAIDSLYRLLVTGQAVDDLTGEEFYIVTARLLPNGGVDQSFAGVGYVVSDPLHDPFNNSGTAGQFIAVDSLNRTVVLGAAQETDNFGYSLSRYLTDGSLDSTFGTDGIVIEHSLASAESGYLNQIIIDPQGRILGTGIINTGVGNNGILVVRHNADGSLDTSFGEGHGYVIVQIAGDGDDEGVTLCLNSSGTIYVGSRSSLEGSGTPISCVLAFDTSGALVTSFGTDGIYTHNFSDGSDTVTSIMVDAQGKIVVGGRFFNPGQCGLFRLLSTGVLDTTFGTNGFASYSYSSNNNIINAITLDAYQRIIGMGSGDNENFFLVMRVSENGQLDTSFGSNGFAETTIYQNSIGTFGLLSPQGRIVVCGGTNDDEGNTYLAGVGYTIGYDLNYYNFQFSDQGLGLL